jgi:ubiquinone/menaquinone biosynthesis C-methylase UbiE
MNEKEMAMDRPMGNFAFRFMAFGYKFRDLRLPRMDILKEVGIKPGFSVLDYGCGPGGYIRGAAQLVTGSGKVYALDIQPLAIKQVLNIAKKRKLTNVDTVLSDCATGLPDESVDVVLLYDIFHGLSQPGEVLKELHRVLKPDGILSFHDHHIEEKEIVSKIAGKGLFQLSQKGARVYNFSKAK